MHLVTIKFPTINVVSFLSLNINGIFYKQFCNSYNNILFVFYLVAVCSVEVINFDFNNLTLNNLNVSNFNSIK